MTTFPQFGYPYPASSQLLMSAAAPSTSCCDTTRPSGSDPAVPPTPGSTVCCPPLDSRTSALLHARVPGLPTLYASPYATESGYLHFAAAAAADPSAFYSPLNAAYDLKSGAEGWSGIPQPTACYPYDPATYQYYGDRYGAMDLNGARRKNATRETTSTLKAWLYEHRKNPYPTKGEKIMLAIITKMTLTQVSTWFANARRRLKKENKMTWSPRNRCGDGRKEDYESDEDEDGEGGERRRDSEGNHSAADNITEAEMERTLNGLDCDGDSKSEENNNDKDNKDDDHITVTNGPTDNERAMAICQAAAARARTEREAALGHPSHHHPRSLSPGIHHRHPHHPHNLSSHDRSRSRSSSPPAHLTRAGSTSPSCASSPRTTTLPTVVKPKIWSLAHTATSSSPDRRPSPGPLRSNGHHLNGLPHGFRQHPYDSPMSTLRQWVDGQFHAGQFPAGQFPIPRMAVHPSQFQHPGAPTSVVSAAQTPLFSTAMTATAMSLPQMSLPHGMRYPLFAHEAPSSLSSASASINSISESSLQKEVEARRESLSESSTEERLRTAFKPVPKRHSIPSPQTSPKQPRDSDAIPATISSPYSR